MSPPLCVALADSSSAIGTCQNALDKYRDAVYLAFCPPSRSPRRPVLLALALTTEDAA